jgi:hypothetical protein
MKGVRPSQGTLPLRVNMSIQAIITRLKRVSQLRTLCLLLNKAREIQLPTEQR